MTEQNPPRPRNSQFSFRLDRELLKQAAEKAKAYGGLGVVIRAMLQAFVRGDFEPRSSDIQRELTTSPIIRQRKPVKRPPKKS